MKEVGRLCDTAEELRVRQRLRRFVGAGVGQEVNRRRVGVQC